VKNIEQNKDEIIRNLFKEFFLSSDTASKEARPVEIKTLLFRYNWTLGSKSSIKFHTGLRAEGTTAQSAIYACEAVK
jgi:hypothetical protein